MPGERRLPADPDRLAVWTASGGPPVALRRPLRDRPPAVRCLVSYYGVLDLRHLPAAAIAGLSPEEVADFSPLAHVEALETPAPAGGGVAPLLLARAGLDRPAINDSVDRFVAAALARNLPVTVLNHPDGRHGFDARDDVPRSREIVRATLEFLRTHLGP